jgi:short subunit dehydrogenase-like uncharacterized protein
MSSALLIYGATGYVGQHVARTAGRLGVKAIVAGRDAAKLDRIASETGLERRAFGLDDPAAIDSALNSVAVVLNCAGPFKYTAEPLVAACLRTHAHYLDITGEIPVYEAIQAMDAQAKARGVMLLPGVGFDVVPTDCLALHLKQRLPSATRLRLAFQSVGPAGLLPWPSGALSRHRSPLARWRSRCMSTSLRYFDTASAGHEHAGANPNYDGRP